MQDKLRELFDLHAVASRQKHAHLVTVVGDLPWSLDAKAGLAGFGDLRFQAQLLGTESHANRSWLWSWVEGKSTAPKAMTKAAERLRGVGVEKGIPDLQQPEQALDLVSGEAIASIASGLFGVGPYFRVAYDGGALFGLVTDPAFPAAPPTDAAKAAETFKEAVAALDFGSQFTAFLGYVKWLKWPHDSDGRDITANDHDGHAVIARFGDDKRLRAIDIANAPALLGERS
jgi:hypothetical protein